MKTIEATLIDALKAKLAKGQTARALAAELGYKSHSPLLKIIHGQRGIGLELARSLACKLGYELILRKKTTEDAP